MNLFLAWEWLPHGYTPHGTAGVPRVSGTSVKTEGTDFFFFFFSVWPCQTDNLSQRVYISSGRINRGNWFLNFFFILIGELRFRFQEFPEKTRPVGFKHPAFHCPDMSPSSSVPSSGLRRTSKPILFSSSYCEFKSNLFVFTLCSSWTCEAGRYKGHRRLGGFADSMCLAVVSLWWKCAEIFMKNSCSHQIISGLDKVLPLRFKQFCSLILHKSFKHAGFLIKCDGSDFKYALVLLWCCVFVLFRRA